MQDAACDVIVDCLPDGTVELLRSTRAPQELKQAHRLIAGQTALTISFKPPELPSSVFIVNHGVHGHVFELEPHKTVGDLQACCAETFGVPVGSQALLVGCMPGDPRPRCLRVDDQAPRPARALHTPCTRPARTLHRTTHLTTHHTTHLTTHLTRAGRRARLSSCTSSCACGP